ncbi:hypothetical protein BHE74_00020543 [Ensete ventricosum]|nr:hypothetical protein BHE74_00020543 [Ensete ventricosum]
MVVAAREEDSAWLRLLFEKGTVRRKLRQWEAGEEGMVWRQQRQGLGGYWLCAAEGWPDGDLEMAAVGSDCGSKRVRDGKKVMAEVIDCSRGGREVASGSPLGRMMLRQGRQMEIAAAIEGSGWEMATVGGSDKDDDDGDGSVDGKGSSCGTARTPRIAALIPIDRTL